MEPTAEKSLIVVEGRREPQGIAEEKTLMQIIARAAADPQYDPAKLAALLAVKKEWEADEARKAFVVALAKFKENPPEIIKNRQVDFENKSGGRTKYKHAGLDQVSSIIGSALAAVGIAHRWGVEQEGEKIKVTCTLTHILGHSESVWLQAAPDMSGGKNSIQAVGSTTEYLRRYTLLAASGVAVKGHDDDGQGDEARQMDEKAKEALAAKIEAAPNAKELESLWAGVAAACTKAGDVPAYEELKKAVIAKSKALKKADNAI